VGDLLQRVSRPGGQRTPLTFEFVGGEWRRPPGLRANAAHERQAGCVQQVFLFDVQAREARA
jgi:hypothetical protein